MVHPDHECENCGKTHMSYNAHVEFSKRNRKTRNILILITCVSIISVPLILTTFDLTKESYKLEQSIDLDLFNKGYDVVCYSDLGMQLCIIKGNDSNHLAYNAETLVIQSKSNPCLNIYLETPDKITDNFMIKDGVSCLSSLEFPLDNGWNYYQYTFIASSQFTPDPEDKFFTAEKIKYWWNDWWLDL